MADHPRGEVQKAIDALHSIRDKASAGEMSWDALADMFTEEATYIDPAWGRFKGRGPSASSCAIACRAWRTGNSPLIGVS